MPKVLSTQAQDDRDEYEALARHTSCSCHISPPCGLCTHPGNPMNQAEDEEAWVEVPEEQAP